LREPIGVGAQAALLIEGHRMSDTVNNNEAEHRYELSVDGQTAIAAYRMRGDVIAFTHTVVPQALEGKGIGTRLIKAVLSDVRERSLRVRAECSFVADYLDRHPADQDLLA
jgi:predicted GNAT family acetyltransferase